MSIGGPHEVLPPHGFCRPTAGSRSPARSRSNRPTRPVEHPGGVHGVLARARRQPLHAPALVEHETPARRHLAPQAGGPVVRRGKVAHRVLGGRARAGGDQRRKRRHAAGVEGGEGLVDEVRRSQDVGDVAALVQDLEGRQTAALGAHQSCVHRHWPRPRTMGSPIARARRASQQAVAALPP